MHPLNDVAVQHSAGRDGRASGDKSLKPEANARFSFLVREIGESGVETNWCTNMKYETLAPPALDYLPCRYEGSRTFFRGPKKPLVGEYVAFLGSSETYGKFVERPYVERIEDRIGTTCVNLGCVNAGIDVFLHDEDLGAVCQRAKMTVVQVMGAQNMSNRFYSVHPRRNDRFVKASVLMQAIFNGIDFTDFNFTRHMLTSVQQRAPERFRVLRDELQEAWVARMRLLVRGLGSRVVLLWVGAEAPGTNSSELANELAREPLFVTRDMIEKIRPHVEDVIEVPLSAHARATGLTDMVFERHEEAAARLNLNVASHTEVAELTAHRLQGML